MVQNNDDINSTTNLSIGSIDKVPPIKLVTKIGFGFGHVFNDLCASIWFTYLIVFMNKVIGQTSLQAGVILFFGQFCDAIATPFIGYFSDKTNPNYYGKRKTWHLVGTFACLLSFIFIFNQCFIVPRESRFSSDWRVFAYYMVFAMIFQFGWAAVQLAHMAIINDISLDNQIRVGLNSLRYAFTVISSIFVYSLCWFLLSNKYTSGSGDSDNDGLGPSDANNFMILSGVVTGVGMIFSILFHIMVKEKSKMDNQQNKNSQLDSRITSVQDLSASETISDHNTLENTDSISNISTNENILEDKKQLSWKEWLKNKEFYQHILCYMLSRVIVNVEQVYISLYILDFVKLDKTMIAISPLIIYVASFITTFIMKYLTGKIGSKFVLLIGIILSGLAGVWLFFVRFKITLAAAITGQMIIICIIIGITGTLLLVSSLAMVNNMIGSNLASSAFVLGMMSFADKILNGAVVLFIQIFIPRCSVGLHFLGIDSCTSVYGDYYRFVLTIVVCVCTLLLLIVLISIYISEKSKKLEKTDYVVMDTDDLSSVSI